MATKKCQKWKQNLWWCLVSIQMFAAQLWLPYFSLCLPDSLLHQLDAGPKADLQKSFYVENVSQLHRRDVAWIKWREYFVLGGEAMHLLTSEENTFMWCVFQTCRSSFLSGFAFLLAPGGILTQLPCGYLVIGYSRAPPCLPWSALGWIKNSGWRFQPCYFFPLCLPKAAF